MKTTFSLSLGWPLFTGLTVYDSLKKFPFGWILPAFALICIDMSLSNVFYRFSYSRENTLKFISSFVQCVYKQEGVAGVTVEDIAAMVTGHPLFHSVMFGEHGQDSKGVYLDIFISVL